LSENSDVHLVYLFTHKCVKTEFNAVNHCIRKITKPRLGILLEIRVLEYIIISRYRYVLIYCMYCNYYSRYNI